jgi:hypothetical protein
MYQHLFEPAPRPTEIDCPKRLERALESVVLRAMRKAPEHRFADMGELAEVLRRLEDDPRPVDVPADEGLPSKARSALGGRVAWLAVLGAVVMALGASVVVGRLLGDRTGEAGATEEAGKASAASPGDSAPVQPAVSEEAKPGAPQQEQGDAPPEAAAAKGSAGQDTGTGTGDASSEAPAPDPARGRKRKRRSERTPKKPPEPGKKEPRTRELPPNPFRSGSRTPGENEP